MGTFVERADTVKRIVDALEPKVRHTVLVYGNDTQFTCQSSGEGKFQFVNNNSKVYVFRSRRSDVKQNFKEESKSAIDVVATIGGSLDERREKLKELLASSEVGANVDIFIVRGEHGIAISH